MFMKEPHTALFVAPTGVGKIDLALNLLQSEYFHCGPRANENFLLFSYLSESKDQTIIEKVLLANDRDN